MNNLKSESIIKHFSNIKEPRRYNKSHKLLDIIIISICAVLSGADSWEIIEQFGKAKKAWFEELLELPHGIPSHDTIARVFTAIDPNSFKESFLS